MIDAANRADLIVFGEDWGGLPSSTQHLVRHLARSRRVLWVDSIGLRRPRLSDLGRILTKLRAMLASRTDSPSAAVEETAPFPVLAPRALPLPGSPLARLFNRRVLAPQVRSAAARAGLHRPLLWISLPTAVDLVGALGESGVVYYCGDDFGALAGVDHAPVKRLEAELAERADLILAASERLVERFPAGKTQLLAHGVDFERFATPAPRALDLPGKGPVAGFYGSIEAWLDQGLLADVARALPAWQFVLIGAVKVDVSRLEAVDNVRFLGPRPHAELPGYAQHWDASLLPFVDNAQIRASNPLKLREYLAAGRPIVTTDFPALDGYRDLVSTVAGADDMVTALGAAAAEGAARLPLRRERVRGESWAARADTLAQLLDTLASG